METASKLTLLLSCSWRPSVREGDRGPDGLDEKCARIPCHQREGEASQRRATTQPPWPLVTAQLASLPALVAATPACVRAREHVATCARGVAEVGRASLASPPLCRAVGMKKVEGELLRAWWAGRSREEVSPVGLPRAILVQA